MTVYGVSRQRAHQSNSGENRDASALAQTDGTTGATLEGRGPSQTISGDVIPLGTDTPVPHPIRTPQSNLHPNAGLPHYVANVAAAVAVLDAFFIGVAQIGVTETIYNPIGLTGPTQLLATASVSVLIYGIFLFFFGSYRREILSDIIRSSSRIAIALVLGGAVLFMLALVARVLYPSHTVLANTVLCVLAALVTTGVAMVGMVASRTVSYAMVNQEWLRRRVPVIATIATVRSFDRNLGLLTPAQPLSRQTAPVSTPDFLARLPRRYVPNVGRAVAILDALCIAVAQIGIIETVYNPFGLTGPTQMLAAATASSAMSMIFLYALGCYRRETLTSASVSALRIIVCFMFSGVIFFVAGRLVFGPFYPLHPVLGNAVSLSTAVLVSLGAALMAVAASRSLAYAMINQEWLKRRILVIGSGQRAQYLRALMLDEGHRHWNALTLVSESAISGTPNNGPSTLHRVGQIESLVRELLIDEIVVATDGQQDVCMESLLACKIYGTPILSYSAFVERETGRVDLGWPDLAWMVLSEGFRLRFIDICFKRAIDVLVSLALLVIALPFLLAAMVAVWIEGTRPVFFTQQRVTLGGRIFFLYKLRTMRPDSENEGPRWAAIKDPRVTRVGAFLRRFRIDEIPQLVNVLQGDMSLVGPRPEQPEFVEQLSREIKFYNLRHSVKAGLTGWAQINYQYGASTADATRKLEYDLYYIKNYSLLHELSIIVQTFRVLLWPPGVR